MPSSKPASSTAKAALFFGLIGCLLSVTFIPLLSYNVIGESSGVNVTNFGSITANSITVSELYIGKQKFPETAGNSNQVLFTDGSGNMFWSDLPTGAGNVRTEGDASARAVVVFADESGDILESSGAVLSSMGDLIVDNSCTIGVSGFGTSIGLALMPSTSLPREIRLYEMSTNGSSYVSLRAPNSIVATTKFQLPDQDGSAGDVLQTDGSGALSFAPVVGTGNVTGLGTSVTNGIPTYNDTSGTTLIAGGATLTSSGNLVANDTVTVGLRDSGTDAGIILPPYDTLSGSTRAIKFQELTQNGTHYVGFKGPDNVPASTVWTLPSADGSIDDILKTDGTNGLSWTANYVKSVNGSSGTVTLEADDIDDTSTTHKFATASQLTQISTNETNISTIQSDLDGFPDALKNLTTAEVNQLENIGTTTISAGQWGYVGNFDQDLITTSDVKFNALTLGTNSGVMKATSGVVSFDVDADDIDDTATTNKFATAAQLTQISTNQTNISSIQSDLDGFPDALKNLTTAEVNQLENIGTTTISAGQWAYVGNFDQDLITTSDVKFNALTIGSLSGILKASAGVVSGSAAVADLSDGGNVLQTSDKGIANGVCPLDGSTKISSTYLPGLALTDVNTVASEAAMIALTAQEGDIAIRTDENKTYVHNGGSVGDATDWSELLTPTDTVTSVNSQTGVVVLDADDIDDASTTHKFASASQLTQISTNETNISTIQSDLDGFPDALKNLTTAEVSQLENIGTTTVSSSQWGYVGNFDQDLITTSDVTFNGLTLGTNSGVMKATSGVVSFDVDADDIDDTSTTNKFATSAQLTQINTNQTNISAIQSDLNGFPDALKNLTTAEVNQLENIGTTTMSAAQWGYVGNFDQDLITTSDVKFNALTIGSLSGILKASAGVVSGSAAIVDLSDGANVLQTSDKGTANGVCPLDGSTKISSTYLPAVALTEVNTVASEAAMIALTAQEGDIAIRTDENKTYAHNGGSAGDVTDWSELLAPAGSVTSVNSQTGVVVLDADDIDDASTTHKFATASQLTQISTNQTNISTIQSDLDGFPDALKNLTTAEVNQLENIGTTTISAGQWGYVGALDQSLITSASPTFTGMTLDTTGAIGMILKNQYVRGGIELENAGVSSSQGILNVGINTNRVITELGTQPGGGWFRVDTRTSSAGFQWYWEAAGSDTETQIMELSAAGQLTIGSSSGVLKATSGVISFDADADDIDDTSTTHKFASASQLTQISTNETNISTIQSDLDGFPDALKNLTTAEVNQVENIGTTTISAAQWAYVGNFDQDLITTSDVKFNALTIGSLSGILKASAGVVSGSAAVADLSDGGNVLQTSDKGIANGVCPLDGSTKISSTYLPGLALTDVNTVASEAAMIALTAQEGDIAIRTDENKTYAHNGGSAGDATDWSELLAPTGSVASVNSQTGVVVLDADDIDDTSTTHKFATASQLTQISTNQSDISTLQTDVDGFPDALKNLTTAEVNQLENIGTTTISSSQWSYVGNFDQDLITTSDVTFNGLTLGTNSGVMKATSGVVSFDVDADDIDDTSTTHKFATASQLTQISTNETNISTIQSDLDGFPDALKNLTTAEVNQLENIGTTTISSSQWGYVGNFDQDLITTSDVKFNALTLGTNSGVMKATSGVVSFDVDADDIDDTSTTNKFATASQLTQISTNQSDISTLQTDVDGFPDALKNLTTAEVNQLENIGTTTMSAAQWSYVGNFDQDLITTSNVTFNGLTLGTNSGVMKATSGVVSFDVDADDIDDTSTTNKFATASQLTQISTNETNISTIQSDLDGFPDALKNLTTSEINQLENIGTTTISAAQWGYVGNFNQDLITSSTVQFGKVGIGTIASDALLDVYGTREGTISARFRSGDSSTVPADSHQILLAYHGTDTYQHSIRSRHSSSTDAGNAIDFYVWNYGTDSNTTAGTNHVMSLDGGNCGIGITSPIYKLHVVGTVFLNGTTTIGSGTGIAKLTSGVISAGTISTSDLSNESDIVFESEFNGLFDTRFAASASTSLSDTSNIFYNDDVSTNGLLVRTGSGTYTSRSISGSSNISVSNGDGVSGNPTIDIIQDIQTTSSPTFAGVTIDSTGAVGMILKNQYVRGGIELENAGTASTDGILNVGINTNRYISELGTQPAGAWFRIDTRSSSPKFSWFWEDASSDTETELMGLESNGTLNLGNVSYGLYSSRLVVGRGVNSFSYNIGPIFQGTDHKSVFYNNDANESTYISAGKDNGHVYLNYGVAGGLTSISNNLDVGNHIVTNFFSCNGNAPTRGRMIVRGTASSISAGGHVEYVTASDDYPLLQQLNWTHDNISFNFDSYYDGTYFRSSDAGSNFQIYKLSDTFKIRYASGYSQGSAISAWSDAIAVASDGKVTIEKYTTFNAGAYSTGVVNIKGSGHDEDLVVRDSIMIKSSANWDGMHGWSILTVNDSGDGYGGANNAGNLEFRWKRNPDNLLRGTISRSLNSTLNDFTATHRSVYEGELIIEEKDFPFYEGKIVIANGQYKTAIADPLTAEYKTYTGKEAITINDAHPIVTLATKANDKRVYGVISFVENNDDPESRNSRIGFFISPVKKPANDQRLNINALGEGAVWVANTAGNIENGDYITTSWFKGYGQKQADDILHNYTVAKATCSCTFDLDSEDYECKEIQMKNELSQLTETIRIAFIGCTYHCA